MNVYDQLNNDKRGFFKFTWDRLINNHSLLILAKKSLIEPFHIRALNIMFNYSTSFAYNAIFFSDSYIDKRANTILVSNISTGFFFTLLNEFSKSLFASVIAIILVFIGGLILRIPEKYEEELNSYFITMDSDKINEGL